MARALCKFYDYSTQFLAAGIWESRVLPQIMLLHLVVILLLEEIRLTTRDVENPVNTRVNHQPQLVSRNSEPSAGMYCLKVSKLYKTYLRFTRTKDLHIDLIIEPIDNQQMPGRLRRRTAWEESRLWTLWHWKSNSSPKRKQYCCSSSMFWDSDSTFIMYIFG